MAAFEIRPFQPSDAEYAQLAALNDLCTPGHWHTVSEWRAFDTSLAGNAQAQVHFAAWRGDLMIGAIKLWEMLRYAAPGRRYLQLTVHPAHRGQGVARALYDQALQAMPETTELFVEVVDYNPDAVAIAEAHGFTNEGIEYEQVCPVHEADAALLESLDARLDGFDVQPLSALKHLPDWRERLHALYIGLDNDVPAPVDYTPITLEQYFRAEVDIPSALHDACFIVQDAGEWVAISELRSFEDGTGRLYQDLTGVRPGWRRRGIASGLKARCVLWARANGYTEIVTWNDQHNAGMLGANAKVGFRPVAQWISYLKQL
jgi:GNAT superfamily N-acetyltransferase